MNNELLSGKWIGQYTYGEGYGDKLAGQTCEFVMELEVSDGVVSGLCSDNLMEKLFDQPATIKGFVENDFINFVKTYPKRWEIDDDGKATVKHDQPSHEVHYTGIFSDGKFHGDWEIITGQVDTKDGLFEYFLSGTWTMHRQ